MKETLYLKKNIQKKSDLRFFRDSSSRIDSRTKFNHPSSNSLLVIRGDIQQCPCFSVRRAKFRVLSLKWHN